MILTEIIGSIAIIELKQYWVKTSELTTKSLVSYIPEPPNHILSFCLFGLFGHQTFQGGIISQEHRKEQANWPLTGGLWRPHLCSTNRNTHFPFWLNVRLLPLSGVQLPIYHLLARFLWEWTVNVLQANLCQSARRVNLIKKPKELNFSVFYMRIVPTLLRLCPISETLILWKPQGEMSTDMTVSDSYMWGGCSYKWALYWS